MPLFSAHYQKSTASLLLHLLAYDFNWLVFLLLYSYICYDSKIIRDTLISIANPIFCDIQ